MAQLQLPLVPVRAVTSYSLGETMHRLLRGYKDAPVAEVRAMATARLADLVQKWLLGPEAEQLASRAGGRWDLVVGVPSSHRQARAPVDSIIARVPELARLHRPLLVCGAERTGHLVASRSGFAVDDRGQVGGGPGAQRALIFDDTLVTGARAQSAAAALRGAGVPVTAVVVIGRVIRSRHWRTALPLMWSAGSSGGGPQAPEISSERRASQAQLAAAGWGAGEASSATRVKDCTRVS